MSLNKFIDYDTNGILDAELKVKKLGLKDAQNNKCLFISNVGDGSIVARDITQADIPGNVPVGSLTVSTVNTGGPANLAGDNLNIPIYQEQITLTTTGTSGPSAFVNGTLNIPQYASGGGSDLTLTTVNVGGPANLSNNNLNIPIYQEQLTLTTTGSSGAAALVNGTLNIPIYSGGGSDLTLTVNGDSGSATLVNGNLNVPQYQGMLTLTTNGTSGNATLDNDILNIPAYTSSGNGGNIIQKYTMNTAYTLPISTAANTIYNVVNKTANQYFGTNSIDFTQLNAGDRINIEFEGTYTNASGTTTSDKFRHVRMYFGTAFLEWDIAADNDSSAVFYTVNSASQVRNFKYNFQVIAKTAWSGTSIDIAVSGYFQSTAYDNTNTKVSTAVFRLKSGTIPDASLNGTGIADLTHAFNSGNLAPTTTGFTLIYQKINYDILKGYYQ